MFQCFASWYCECNPDQVKKFRSSDTVFLLAFAIIMLNTDLHNKSIKQDRKMKLNDFIKNLRGGCQRWMEWRNNGQKNGRTNS